MDIDPRLHHYCQKIAKGFLQDMVEMYKLLQFKVVYTPPDSDDWIMIGQEKLRFAIQVIQVSDEPIADIHQKRQTHIGFISNAPQEIIEEIRIWAEDKGLRFRQGGWSDREFYFDLPDVFVDFVVEVMHSSIEET